MAPRNTEHERFLSLLETYQRPLLKVCWVYSNTSHDRDDLLQEMVSQLWKSFGKYDSERSFSTWMYRVALNVAIDFKRKQRRLGREKTSLGHDETISAMGRDDIGKSEQSRELHDLLEQQSEEDRALLLLYLESHSLREIGEVLGISESNVSTRLYRLKKSLRQAAQEPSEATTGV